MNAGFILIVKVPLDVLSEIKDKSVCSYIYSVAIIPKHSYVGSGEKGFEWGKEEFT